MSERAPSRFPKTTPSAWNRSDTFWKGLLGSSVTSRTSPVSSTCPPVDPGRGAAAPAKVFYDSEKCVTWIAKKRERPLAGQHSITHRVGTPEIDRPGQVDGVQTPKARPTPVPAIDRYAGT